MEYSQRQNLNMPPPPNLPQKRQNRRSGQNTLIIFLFVLVVLLGALAGYFYYKSERGMIKFTDSNNEADLSSLIEEVGKVIVLPTDEKPTIATVTDIEKLKGQPFFEKAKEGYRVLIYTNNKKAVLYDPFEKRVVEVGSLNLDR